MEKYISVEEQGAIEAKKIKVEGVFKYNGDSKRFHRYKLKAEDGIVGSLYVPQDIDTIPDRIVLEKATSEDVNK